MSKPTCRWGILGAANIARKNWQAIRDAGNASLVAVASRDLGRAQAFVGECQVDAPHPHQPLAIEGYEALLARPDIDAVYIPLPTGVRTEWAVRAAEAGKHVLAEKPAGCSAAEVRKIITACARNRVQYMDGVMFMHSRRLQRLRTVLDDGASVGSIRHIASQFSYAGDDDFFATVARTHGVLEPLGCLGDLGWYCIRLPLWALGEQLPLQVTGRICSATPAASGNAAVPLEFSGELFFAGGVSASFHCSFTAHNAQWAMISGSRGLLQLTDFVIPFAGSHTRFGVDQSEFELKNCQFNMREKRFQEQIEEPANNAPGSQEAALFRDFSECVLTGRIDPRWPEMTLNTQRVLDACLWSARHGSAPTALGNLASH
jgi:predicted dehydrogenase